MAGFKKWGHFRHNPAARLPFCLAAFSCHFYNHLSASAQTGPPFSTVRVTHDVLDSAGGLVSGPTCSEVGSLGGITGSSSSSSGMMSDRGGWTAQLTDTVALKVSSPQYMNEGALLRLTALAKQDDGIFTLLPPAEVAWTVIRGAENADVSRDGHVQAAIVYQESAAVIRLIYGLFKADAVIVILNVNPDNFELYAGDALPDLWQIKYFGISSAVGGPDSDPDGDGKDNRNEFIAKTSPVSSVSGFNATLTGGPGQWRLTFPTAPDRHYLLETSTTMTAGSWSVIAGPLAGSGATLSFPVALEPGARRFYRVRVGP